jgi:hypothetical protein
MQFKQQKQKQALRNTDGALASLVWDLTLFWPSWTFLRPRPTLSATIHVDLRAYNRPASLSTF